MGSTIRISIVATALMLCAAASFAAPRVEQLAPNLYAYVSDNDRSANSTFLVGQHGILVVDTGLNTVEGKKLLAEIRTLSPLPVQFVVNTHYHTDHLGGNGVVGPDAIVITSPFTRERTVQAMGKPPASAGAAAQPLPVFRAATETLTRELTVYVDDNPVEIIAPGPGHTMGDVYVFFPKQRTVSAGDLFMNNSCPAMDQGSAQNWVHTLDTIMALPADHFVPGHFDVGTRATLTRFRDYLSDLTTQVEALVRSGATAAQVRERIDMKKHRDFRQYPQFRASFADNAETVFHQLQPAH
jgi:cyclase